MFHRHYWEEVNRSYTPGLDRTMRASYITMEELDRLVFGVTLIEQRCTGCGTLKHYEVVGSI